MKFEEAKELALNGFAIKSVNGNKSMWFIHKSDIGNVVMYSACALDDNGNTKYRTRFFEGGMTNSDLEYEIFDTNMNLNNIPLYGGLTTNKTDSYALILS